MISDSDRVTAVELINEARASGCRLQPACDELNISPRTYQRWTEEGDIKRDQRPLIDRPTPKNKLTEEERKELIEVVNSPEYAFKLYDTYGLPLEFTQELAQEKGIIVDVAGFHELFAIHQEKSRAGAAQKFKGGLSDNSEETIKLHTATHLLHAALRKVLGDSVVQRGSNINPQRLRFDFSFERKLTAEELTAVEKIVNQAIEAEIDVVCSEISINEAKASGAIGVFTDKYGERVKVYTIKGYSKEICGGPHVSNTKELGSFKILQEGSSSAGVRRIKACLGGGQAND